MKTILQELKAKSIYVLLHDLIGYLSLLPLIGFFGMGLIFYWEKGRFPLPNPQDSNIGFKDNSLFEVFKDLFYTIGAIPLLIFISLIVSMNLFVTGRKELISAKGFWLPILVPILFIGLIISFESMANLLNWVFD